MIKRVQQPMVSTSKQIVTSIQVIHLHLSPCGVYRNTLLKTIAICSWCLVKFLRIFICYKVTMKIFQIKLILQDLAFWSFRLNTCNVKAYKMFKLA